MVNVVGFYFKGVKIIFEVVFFELVYELSCYLLEWGYYYIGFIGVYMDNCL